MQTRQLRFLAVAAALGAGCFNFAPASGTIRCGGDPAHPCPDGYSCVSGSCWKLSDLDLGGGVDSGGDSAIDMLPVEAGSNPNGDTCASASACASGNCADGRCCDKPCNDECHACNIFGYLGICSPVNVGDSPANAHPACGPDPMSGCQRDGRCDGHGKCELWANVVCNAASCATASNRYTGPAQCDGKGNCVTPASMPCDPYVCMPDGSGCYQSCTGTDASHCKSPNPCSSGSCGTRSNGMPCLADTDCTSGNCVDAICCDTPKTTCTGCRGCNVPGSVGSCTNIPINQDPHGFCPAPCTSGCDGAGACGAASGTVCMFACADSVDFQFNTYWGQYTGQNQTTSTCAATPGMCNTASPTKGYCLGMTTCASAAACKSGCTKDSDCLLPYYCDAGGTCQHMLATGSTCTRNRQCQGNNCVGNKCVTCATGADCDMHDPFCNATAPGNGQCERCDIHANSCQTAGLGICNTTRFQCECVSDADCTNPRAPHCYQSPTYKYCTCDPANGGCNVGYACVFNGGTGTGVCKVPSGATCVQNVDCVSGACNTTTGVCS